MSIAVVTGGNSGIGRATSVALAERGFDGEHGILVNAVAPGEIATKMTGQEDEDPRSEDRPVPVGRPGDAREVGALIAFLASPDNGYVTGQSYVIDGGMLVTTAQTR